MTTHYPPRWRIALVREADGPAFATAVVRTSADVARAFHFLADHDREEVWLVALDQRHRITGTNQVSVGSLSASPVSPREVLKPLILSSAAACFLVHVHPSGDPAPSSEDHAITHRLVQACDLLGIRVLDHVIIGGDRHFSFADAGALGGTGGPPC